MEGEKTPGQGFGPQTSGSNSKLEAFFGRNTKIVGKVSFTGAVEVDGYIEGEIEASDRLIIGEAAQIHAKVSGTEVIVRGTVTGDISASKRLALHKSARVVGNVSCSSLSVEEGAILEGNCAMPLADGNNSLNKSDLRLVAPKAATAK